MFLFCLLLYILTLVAKGIFADPLADISTGPIVDLSVTSQPPLLSSTPSCQPSWQPSGSEINCTSTRFIPGSFTRGPVRTVWTATATATIHLDCGGCPFLATVALGHGHGPGPVVHYTTTTTAATPRTTTTYICLRTPSAVVNGSSSTATITTSYSTVR